MQQVQAAPSVQPTDNNNDQEKTQSRKKILYKLAVSEVVFGVMCVIFAIVIAGIVGSRPFVTYQRLHYVIYPYYAETFTYSFIRVTTGEGIWCGIWIIIAGSLGISAGKENSSKCLIYTHMAFSIVGSVFAATLFSIAVPLTSYAAINPDDSFLVALNSLVCICSFPTFIIQIISASYCCVITKCCKECCQPIVTPSNNFPMVYTNQGMVQGGPPTTTFQTGTPGHDYGATPTHFHSPVHVQPVGHPMGQGMPVPQSPMHQPHIQQPPPYYQNK